MTPTLTAAKLEVTTTRLTPYFVAALNAPRRPDKFCLRSQGSPQSKENPGNQESPERQEARSKEKRKTKEPRGADKPVDTFGT